MRHHTLAAIGMALLLGLVPMLLAAQTHAAKSDAVKVTSTTIWPVTELKWEAMAGLPGAEQARLWGDPTKEAHGIFYRWPAGTKVPLHTHTSGDRGIIISGTMLLTPEGSAPKRLAPGSYFSMAGGTKHATAAEDGAPLVFFVEREGAFDAVMVDAAAKKTQ